MSKITIEGNAKREFKCDIMDIILNFTAKERTTALASQAVLGQCEDFLEQIAELGIGSENVNIGDDAIKRNYFDGKTTITVTRKIRVRVPFDVKLLNEIMLIIQGSNYSVDVSTEYINSNLNEIYKELLKEATEASRQRAEAIAESMGRKITGVESIEYVPCDYSDFLCGGLRESCFICEGEHETLKHSDALSAPVNEHSQCVKVVWIME